MRNAIESDEGAERWRVTFEEFLLSHLEEIEDAMAERPDLFSDPRDAPSKKKKKKKKKKVKTKFKKKTKKLKS
jgi:hypothetical protein